jgi:hypothetical protein
VLESIADFQLAPMSASYSSPSRTDFSAVKWIESQAALRTPEVAMMIFVPFKPVVLVLGLLSGLIFAGFLGSSLLEGKAPFAVDKGETPRAVVKQDAVRATPEHKHPQKAPSTRTQ